MHRDCHSDETEAPTSINPAIGQVEELRLSFYTFQVVGCLKFIFLLPHGRHRTASDCGGGSGHLLLFSAW